MAQIGEISVKITADASDLSRDLAKAQSQLSRFGDTMRSIGSRVGNTFSNLTRNITHVGDRMRELGRRGRELGDNISEMGENMIQGITVPLAALSAASVKASLDMSRLGSIVKSNMVGVKGSIEEVQGVAERVFLRGLGKSAEDVGRTVAQLKRHFDNLNATQLENLALQIHGVAEALGVDAAGVLEDVIKLTKEYGITTQQALDLIAAGYDASSLKGKNLSKVLKEVSGSAKEMAQIMQNDPTVKWRGNLRQLLNAIAPLGDELLRFANDIMPTVISSIQRLVNWFTRQSTTTKNLIIAFGGLMAILPLMTLTFGALISMGSSVLSFFGTIGSVLGRVGTSVANFVKNFKNLGTLGRIIGPIGLVITALTILYNTSKEFASFVDTTFKGVLDGLKNTFSNFTVNIEPLKASLATLGNTFSQLWTKIEPLVVTFGQILVAAIVVVIAVINGLLNALGPLIGVIIQCATAVLQLVNAFLSLLMLDFSGFLESINGFVESFVSILMGLVDTVVALFTGMWNMLVSVFAAFGVNLNALAMSVFTGLLNIIITIGTSIASFFSSLWSGIQASAVAVWNGIKSAISSIWNSIRSLASSVWNGIKSAITTAVNSTASALSSAWSRIKSTATSAWNSIKSTATSAWNSIKSTVTNAMNNVANAVRNGFNRAKSAVSSAASSIRSILSSLASSAFAWGRNLGSMFARGISSAISRAVAAARNAAAKIKAYLGFSSPTEEGPGRDSDKWAPNLMKMLAKGIEAGIPRLETSVYQAANVIADLKAGQTAHGTTTNTINIYPQRADLNVSRLMRELERASRLNGGRFI